ncbi:MAG: hypothetical protein QXG86_03510 [Candidatus Woesearchaeota archaeon]
MAIKNKQEKQPVEKKEIEWITEKLKQQSYNYSNLELRVQIVEEHIKHLQRRVEELKNRR